MVELHLRRLASTSEMFEVFFQNLKFLIFVFSVEQKSENFEDFVMRSLATYGLTDANKIRLTMDNDFEEVNLANFPENINVVDNVNHAIDKVKNRKLKKCYS